MTISKVLYRTGATAQGGRSGKVCSDDGELNLDLAAPPELGGDGGVGTNPEQLFAAGYAACFQSALLAVAEGYGVDLSRCAVRVDIEIGPTGRGGMGLGVEIGLADPESDAAELTRLASRAHRLCPYSRAVEGNVEVRLTVQGAPAQLG
ncbi:Ohr family peroxiredoxin [Plantactinospora siamensis]|uniref:Ohr family peroxiredoxin n=1 Tax=Plantactinospora siamensis TaxID=555372 RepID=A0ABV6NWW8_9ACTN